jgi:hypothetical protein
MLPHAHDRPAFIKKSESLPTIAVNVLAKLLIPEVAIGPWVHVVLRAAVPEATVDEEGEAL